jgi:hypothetical protein
MKFTLDPTVSCFIPGMSLGTQVFFSNIGVQDAGSFTLELNLNGNTFTTMIDGLAAGESANYWFSDSGTSMDFVDGLIDSLNEVEEGNEDNNTYHMMIPIPTPYVSCTPTSDPNVTNTPTATITPTITGTPPTATPSPIPGYAPLINGGFEEDTNGDKIPDIWKGKTLDRAHRVCDKPGKQVAFRGSCAFQFKPLSTGALSQKVPIVVDQVFTVLTFSTWTEFKHVTVGGLTIKAKVIYADDTTTVLTLTNPPSDAGYIYSEDTLELTAAVKKVIVSFRPIGALNGKIRIDDVAIWLQ